MSEEEPIEKPKLVIDDDWKERVQSEKAAAAAAASSAATKADAKDARTADAGATDAGATDAGATDAGATDAGAAGAEVQDSNTADDAHPVHEYPAASFATLVHSLTAQALASLGQIPDAAGKTSVELGLGKHFIDTLAVLEEKTKGNLDEDESAALAKMLYELRMLFVHVRQNNKGTGPY